MYRETICVCDGLIIIGKCNKEALKKLNKKYKCVVRLELEGRLMIRDSCAPADESGWSDYCI